MYKAGIKQENIRKESSMNMYDPEDEMVYLYFLMHLSEYSYEDDDDIKEHAIFVHNSGKGKGKFQGKFHHCGKKVHIAIYCLLNKKEVTPKIYSG